LSTTASVAVQRTDNRRTPKLPPSAQIVNDARVTLHAAAANNVTTANCHHQHEAVVPAVVWASNGSVVSRLKTPHDVKSDLLPLFSGGRTLLFSGGRTRSSSTVATAQAESSSGSSNFSCAPSCSNIAKTLPKAPDHNRLCVGQCSRNTTTRSGASNSREHAECEDIFVLEADDDDNNDDGEEGEIDEDYDNERGDVKYIDGDARLNGNSDRASSSQGVLSVDSSERHLVSALITTGLYFFQCFPQLI